MSSPRNSRFFSSLKSSSEAAGVAPDPSSASSYEKRMIGDGSILRRNFIPIVIFYLLLTILLLTATATDHPDLHTILDTTVLLLTAMLAWLLWDIGSRTDNPSIRWLALGFAVSSILELFHALTAIPWHEIADSIAFAAIRLRPSSWPPPAHLLPISILAALWRERSKRVSLGLFGCGLIALSAGLLMLFSSLPPYVQNGPLGITRPFLLLVPLLWLSAGFASWRRRGEDRVFSALAMTAALMLAAHSFMLFSRSPHDATAMVAHLGEAAGFLFLLIQLMQMGTADMQQRIAVERELSQLNKELERRVLERTAQIEAANRMLVDEIAERNRTADALREKEALLHASDRRLADIVHGMTEACFALDAEWRFTFVNDRSETLLRHSREEMIGRSIWEVFYKLVGTPMEKHYRRAMAERAPGFFEAFSPIAERWLGIHLFPSGDGLAAFLLDIQERKQAEEALRKSEERLRFSLHWSHTGGWDLDLTDFKAYRTLEHDRIFGYESLLPEWTYQMFLDHVLPEDRAEVDCRFQEAAATQKDWNFECRIRRADGEVRWIWATGGHQLDGEGRAQRMAGIVQDITERKQAEEKIREQAALLDIASDAILVRDLEQRILFWNKGAERIYGWTQTEALGKQVNELLYKGDLSHYYDARKKVFENGEWVGQLKQATKDGKEILVECRWTLVRNDAGNPQAVLAVNTDVTEKKKLEAQLLRSQRMESIGTLAGGIAHDLNNVLAPILMSMQMLKKKIPDESVQRLLSTLETAGHRGADLVRQVLSFGRGMEGERSIVQAKHLILEMEKIAKETFPKSIEIRSDVPKDLWTLSANATQLHQVLLNLCVNARDAMPNGGKLTISAKNFLIDQTYAQMHIDAKEGPYVYISVADTGEGIPPEAMDKIFDPFFTTKEFGKGTGLGLSTVFGIVKSHGGFINVYSEPGKGTEFKVYLPAEESPETQQAKEELKELPFGQGETVLVVDDEASIREITKLSLEASGYNVLTACDGIDAVTVYLLHSDEIEVVLTDMMMPAMDGPTTIRALQKINPNVKIIGVSGLAKADKNVEAARLGVKAFLPKPYTTEELLKILREVIIE